MINKGKSIRKEPFKKKKRKRLSYMVQISRPEFLPMGVVIICTFDFGVVFSV